ncbi:hypothetical protein [Brachyspira sp.]|uniref:hypothetical protein n=1 Tax=Brachyspira sp. TaxID=1977261 RepID=UPI003D7D2C93
MKKIIILFLMFSAVVFAEWQYSMGHNKEGVNYHFFIVYDIYDNEKYSSLMFNVTLDIDNGMSSVIILNNNVKENDNLSLYIKDNSGDSINYSIFKKDIEKGFIGIQNSDKYNRGDAISKLLVSAQSVELYNNDTRETLATFDTQGLKQILQKRLGNSDWYKYKINE